MLLHEEEYRQYIQKYFKRPQGSIFLTPENLRTIEDETACLDDSIIINYINILLNKYDKENEVLLIDSLLYPILIQYMQNGIPRYPDEKILESMQHIQPKYKKIIVPLYIEERYHWVLLFVDIDNGNIHYYDSMHNKNSAQNELKKAKRLFMFLDIQNRIKLTDHMIDFKMIDHGRNTIPQQNDSNNCGLYTIIFSEYILKNIPINNQVKIDVKQERINMLKNIVQDVF